MTFDLLVTRSYDPNRASFLLHEFVQYTHSARILRLRYVIPSVGLESCCLAVEITIQHSNTLFSHLKTLFNHSDHCSVTQITVWGQISPGFVLFVEVWCGLFQFSVIRFNLIRIWSRYCWLVVISWSLGSQFIGFCSIEVALGYWSWFWCCNGSKKRYR